MMDANQVWDVAEAIAQHAAPGRVQPLLDRGADQPRRRAGPRRASPAPIAPIGVATGEHCQNRVIFKQLLQADAIGFCQIDACRLGGVNEVLAVLLLAAKFGVPVCPHAGGVGLCEYVQHLSIFDYICVGGRWRTACSSTSTTCTSTSSTRCGMRGGRYARPSSPATAAMRPESLDAFEFPEARRGGRDPHEPARARAGAAASRRPTRTSR